MSLEQALKENTEALIAHTALLGKMLDQTEGATANASAAASSADSSTAETPKRERGKPSPGKARRTSEEVAEDEAADKADAEAAAAGGETKSDGVTFETLKGKLAKWLGEFAKEEDKPVEDETEAQKKAREANFHPEVVARKGALKAALNKLTGTDDGKLGAIANDADQITKLNDWYENKAKVADKGHGKGRLAPDPEPANTGGDDELDI